MSNLSEEEKKAIEKLKETDTKLFDTILNLIEKQSKEIEELKEESKEYQIGFAQGCYEKDLDWEDKIKAKIEEYNIALSKNQTIYSLNKMEEIRFAIRSMQELLEERN